jgi:peptidylprolyl isomerase
VNRAKLKGMLRVETATPQKNRYILAALLVVVVIGTAAFAGCSASDGQKAKVGDTVNVTYTGSLDNGQVFDSNVGKKPLTFTVGDGQMIQGFDEGVQGMVVGETKNITIPADKGYPYRKDLVYDMNRVGGLENMNLSVGDVIRFTRPDGMPGAVKVLAVNATSVTVDENTPLAGKTLHFTVTLDQILKI